MSKTTAALRRTPIGRSPRARWILFTSAGEALGFLVPASTGAALAVAGAPPCTAFLVAVASGAVEGAVLGAAQGAAVLHGADRRRWAVATSAGAALAWSIGMLPSTVGLPGNEVLRWSLIAAGALVLLLSIPTAQWLVVRHRPHALRWIPVNAGAWVVAIAWTAAPSPLVDERTPVPVLVALYAVAGVLMAVTVAALTASAAVRLLLDPGVPRP